MNNNIYREYQKEAVMTMTQEELLLRLYDELLKRIAAAELLLEKKNYQEFEKQAARAEDIVRYLQQTLNFDYPLSRELYQMYDFFLRELSRFKFGRSAQAAKELRPLVQTLREAFAEAQRRIRG